MHFAGGLLPDLDASAVNMAVLLEDEQHYHLPLVRESKDDTNISTATPVGQRVLVDGGPDLVGAIRALNAHLPFWDRRLDLVIATHTDEDHLAGLVGVVQRHTVGAVVEGIPGTSSLYLSWRQALEEKSIEPIPVHRGASIDLGDGLTMKVLNPLLDSGQPTESDSNNHSMVLRLKIGDVSFLLTGDIEEEIELELVHQIAFSHLETQC